MRKVLFLMALFCWISHISFAQNRQLSGFVANSESGEPLAGASISIKGSSKGTTTGNDGKFTLTLPNGKNVTLVISSTGFTAQEFRVTNQSSLEVKLVSDSKALDNVVVVGYGTVKKKDLTGAVSSLQPGEIVRSNPANVTAALQGQVAGVVVTKASNLPGQAFAIDIRGENTITGVTEPLVVIDGVIGGRLRDINPADIQSIDVLKDASSTAIYGSRGANGVVIVTSKKGSSGRPKISVDGYIGQKSPAHLPALQNAAQFAKSISTDWALNGGTPATFTVNEQKQIDNGKGTDWVRSLTHKSMNTGATVALSGGSPGTTYRFSGGYIQEDGSIPASSFKNIV